MNQLVVSQPHSLWSLFFVAVAASVVSRAVLGPVYCAPTPKGVEPVA